MRAEQSLYDRLGGHAGMHAAGSRKLLGHMVNFINQNRQLSPLLLHRVSVHPNSARSQMLIETFRIRV